MVEAIEDAGGKVTCFPANNNIELLLQYPKIIRYCKEHQIQLIHAHLPWAGFVSRLVHKKTRIPLFYTEHNLQERYHFITKFFNKLSFNWQTIGIGVSEDVTQSIQKNISPNIPVKTILNGVTHVLAKKEFELLFLLAAQPGRVFLRNEILSQVWGNDVIVGGRTIDVHIRKLREKIGDDFFKTIKGVGYKFSNPDFCLSTMLDCPYCFGCHLLNTDQEINQQFQ